MKKVKLLPAQEAEIKRSYLQATDAELAKRVGMDAKSVKAFREQNNLVRGQFTEAKLTKNIEVNESEFVESRGDGKVKKTISSSKK